MSLYNDKDLLRQIIISHYDQPNNKIDEQYNLEHYTCFHNKSLSCIDDLEVCLKIENNIIIDAKFKGIGCAISSASTDIFCDLLKNKDINQAKMIIKNYQAMIKHETYNEDLLEELNAFNDIYLQPNRIKCSLIGYDAISHIIGDKKDE